MLSDKYNYTLNGIEHEIILNNSIKIDKAPLNDKILVSNKYMVKYINDLMDYHSIEYCFVGESLLGIYIFKGINIFNSLLEICTSDINFFKLKKLEDEIKKDGFEIFFNNNNIRISSIFFDNVKTNIYIYPLENQANSDMLQYNTVHNKLILHEFYDIYNIKKIIFEEFEVSVPNKMEKVLETFDFNLDYIIFTKNKNKDCKKIIEEIEIKPSFNLYIKDGINKFISIVKPFIYN